MHCARLHPNSALRSRVLNRLRSPASPFRSQAARRGFRRIENTLAPPSFLSFLPLPEPGTTPIPVLLPTAAGNPSPAFLPPRDVVDTAAPPLNRDEEVYALSLVDLAKGLLGEDVASIVSGEAVDQPQVVARFLLSILTTGRVIQNDEIRGAVERVQDWAVGSADMEDEEVDACRHALCLCVACGVRNACMSEVSCQGPGCGRSSVWCMTLHGEEV